MMSVVRASLRSRFQGSMVGGVIGDCVGAPFEATGSGGSTRYVTKFAKKIPSSTAGIYQMVVSNAMTVNL